MSDATSSRADGTDGDTGRLRRSARRGARADPQRPQPVSDARSTPPGPRRTNLVIAAAVALLFVAGGVILLLTRETDEPTPSPSVTDQSTSPVTTERARSGGADPTSSVDVASVPDVQVTFGEVSAELSDIAPTEIVGLADDGRLVELHLPSGRIRTTQFFFDITRSRLAVTDGATFVYPYASFGGVGLSSTTGDVVVIDRPVVDVASTPTRDEFVIWYESEVARITSTGTAERLDWADPAGTSTRDALRLIDFDGRVLEAGTSGLYRLDESGAERVTSGDLVASGRNHLLLRECDLQRNCQLRTLDGNDNSTLYATDVPDDVEPAAALAVAPDGGAVLFWGPPGPHSSATFPRLLVFDLVDAGTVSVFETGSPDPNVAWSSDGSGIIVDDGRLRWIDRRSGEAVPLPFLGRPFLDLTTRSPQTKPVCDGAIAVADRTVAMRDDDSLAPPAIELLRGLERTATGLGLELAAEIGDYVDFLDTFVGADRAESERLANWPSDVRAGVEAVERFADEVCR